MKLIQIKEELKESYFNKHFPKSGTRFNEEKMCLNCGEIINTKDFKLEQIETYNHISKNQEKAQLIVCPNAPKCDGNALDFMPKDYAKRF
jgi:hypothetical protein